MSLIRKAFKRLHYSVDIITRCVRWYLAYALSLRNFEEMMTERGIRVDHSTLFRWVIRLTLLLGKAFVPWLVTGVWMRRTSKSKVSGNTCIGRLIPSVKLLIFY
ncbi:hypothetical protein XBFM1_2530010 [Xenorhabdus bovienii str. feltiae Moldova]|uniref:Transposase n=1 Tax=Xenorhabdus bovienii str. feltiae Moldova TaxID=1398200 RepID=A0A077NV03_XENBV|nr:hypothetical protein XBFM1_2530010 [Xenorhabdus bovienii str. feltiae Moldova]